MKANRRLSLLLALVMMLSMLPINAAAIDGTSPTISVNSVNAIAGTDVSVDVSIENNPGIMGATLTLKYDNGLSLTGVTAGEAFDTLTMTPPKEIKSNSNFLWDGLDEEATANGVILHLKFTVDAAVPSGTSLNIYLSCVSEDIYNSKNAPVDVQIKNGSVTVIDYTPGDVNNDGRHNGIDVTLLRQYIADKEGYGVSIREASGDVDANGRLNGIDVTLIRQYIADKEGYGVELKSSPLGCSHSSLTEVPAKPYTCTEDGNIPYWQCCQCGKCFSDAEGKTEITLAATVEKAKGHTEIILPGKAATSTEPGLTEGIQCSVCGKWIKRQEPITANGYEVVYHLYSDGSYLEKHRDGIKNPNASFYTSQDGLRLTEPNANGYRFKYWYIGNENNPVTEIAKGTSGKVDVYAMWERIKYTIQFNSPDNPVADSYYYIDEGRQLNDPYLQGYTFIGWSLDGRIVKEIPIGSTGNIVLQANWTSNRNKGVAVNKLDDPIIIEDMDKSRFLFVYKIGEITNVPLNTVTDYGNTDGINFERTIEITDAVSRNTAKEISQTVAKATTSTSSWTLSEEWNQGTRAENTNEEINSKTKETTDSLGNTVSSEYYISNVEGGSTATSSSAGGSSASSSKVTTGASAGVSGSYTRGSELDQSAKLTVAASLEVEAHAGTKLAGTSVKGSFSAQDEFETARKDTESATVANNRAVSNSTESNYSSSSNWNTSDTSTKSWNSESGYKAGEEASKTSTLSNEISNQIAITYSIESSNDHSRGKTETGKTDSSISDAEEYTSTVEYHEESTYKTSQTVKTKGTATGFYRDVIAGTVHVFAVVGYDIASNSYFTYTYSILDKERHPFLDYQIPTGNGRFNDCENAVLPFEVPYYIEEYIAGVIGRSDGLVIDTEDGCVTKYEGSGGNVVIPQYISVDNGDGTNTPVRIRSISKSAFANNDKITGIILSKYISEIPEGAFEGCTNLSEFHGLGVTKIGSNAFKGCTSLSQYTVDEYIKELGTDAFEGVGNVVIKASNVDIAINGVSCGANNLTINIANMKNADRNGLAKTLDDTLLETVSGSEKFELIGNGGSFNNLRIKSDAEETIINNITFADNSETPLVIDSSSLTLNRVNIKNAARFAMVLKHTNTNVALHGKVSANSASDEAMLCKNVTLNKLNANVDSSLNVNGNILACGEINDNGLLQLPSGKFIGKITEVDFTNYLNSVTISFDANGGTLSESSRVYTYGQEYGSLPTPTLKNYDFTGWYDAKVSGSKIESTQKATIMRTLYAHWSPKVFTVSFDANEGSVSTASKQITFNTPLGTLPAPTRNYYIFDGWFTAKSGGTQVTTSTVFGSADAVTVYAHWSRKTAILKFDTKGGTITSGVATKEVSVQQPVGTLPSVTRDYYQFKGWYTNASGGSLVTETTLCEDNKSEITLYAHWELNEISDWVLSSSVPSGAQTVEEKWTYTKTETTTSTDASLSGWTQTGSQWKQTGTGTWQYASYPKGFDTSNAIYSKYNKNALSAFDNGSTKRDVSSASLKTYVYWHWNYTSCGDLPANNRLISDSYSSTYWHFATFESATNYGHKDRTGAVDNSVYYCDRGVQWDISWWWWRFSVYEQTYTDYQMEYHYEKATDHESASEITAGGEISNVQHWVRYRSK